MTLTPPGVMPLAEEVIVELVKDSNQIEVAGSETLMHLGRLCSRVPCIGRGCSFRATGNQRSQCDGCVINGIIQPGKED